MNRSITPLSSRQLTKIPSFVNILLVFCWLGIAGVNGDFYTYAGSDEYSYYNSENSFTNSDETDSGEDYMRSKTPTVIYSEEYDDSESGNVEKIEESIQGSELQPLDVQRRYDNWVTAEELDSKLSQFAWKKGDFRITPYGTLWISSAYDTSAITPGEFALYAKSKDVDNTSDFCVDARTSRVGLMVNGPKIDSFPDTELLGVLEVDFQGVVNVTENKGGLQLRKAYVDMLNKERETKIELGQNWEVISPLYPQMLGYLPCGFVGNIGYRRAQLSFEKGITVSRDLHFLGQIALCDNINGDFASTGGVTNKSGGWPLIEARVATSFFDASRNGLPITIGLSGHIGETIYDFAGIAGTYASQRYVDKSIKTWSFNIDLDVPISEKYRFQGECYTGSNLSSFCGGINQGVDLFTRNGIRDTGAWGSLHSKITDKLANNTGVGVDNPNDKDLVGNAPATNGITSTRTKNTIYFTNLTYNWSKNLMTGVEFSYWITNYRRADVSGDAPVYLPMAAGKAFRTEMVVQYSF